MSVTNETTLVEEAGNGSKTAFNFAFKIFATTDIVAYKKSAAGVYTLGVLGVDYTVTFDTTAETGTVTWTVAPVSGGASAIARDTPATQTTTFPREGVTPARTLENALDRLTLKVQELEKKLDRTALQAIVPTAYKTLVVEAPVDAKGLRWRQSGDTWYIESTDYDPDDPDGYATAAAASATAAAASAAAAIAAAAGLSVQSGLYSARPAAPSALTWYYSTDREQTEVYIPAASKWVLFG